MDPLPNWLYLLCMHLLQGLYSGSIFLQKRFMEVYDAMMPTCIVCFTDPSKWGTWKNPYRPIAPVPSLHDLLQY